MQEHTWYTSSDRKRAEKPQRRQAETQARVDTAGCCSCAWRRPAQTWIRRPGESSPGVGQTTAEARRPLEQRCHRPSCTTTPTPRRSLPVRRLQVCNIRNQLNLSSTSTYHSFHVILLAIQHTTTDGTVATAR